MNFEIFLSSVTAFVAIAALVRPDVTRVLNRFRDKTHLSTHGFADMGFAVWGPTLGIYGAIYTAHSERVLNKIVAQVTHMETGNCKTFEWYVQRQTSANLSHSGQESFELASPIVLRPQNPIKFNYLLCDLSEAQKIESILIPVRQEFDSYRKEKESIKEDPSIIPIKFISESRLFSGAATELQSLYFWNPGKYICDITAYVEGIKPEKISYSFTLKHMEAEEIKKNSLKLILGIIGASPNQNYNFAYRKLEPLK